MVKEVSIEWRLGQEILLLTEALDAAKNELQSCNAYLDQGYGTSIHCFSIGHHDIKNAIDKIRGCEQKITELKEKYFGTKAA